MTDRAQTRGRGLVAAALAAALALATPAAAQETAAREYLVRGLPYLHAGGGVFARAPGPDGLSVAGPVIDLRRIQHYHDPASNPDVPLYTDITLPGEVPPLLDAEGRAYALITLYNIDPPLEDLPSREEGVDRGMDYRDPSNIVKGVYSNYVSPVFTNDRERRPVAGHPIGHFYVKVEIPGIPAILTGMTTIAEADTQLVELTLGRELGLGGALLTRQPGRLYSAAEVMRELSLRQRELVVIDGVNYRRKDGRNVGPRFVIEDGNVTFLRLRLPLENAHDGLEVFLEFLRREQHNYFGSLLSRPHRGTGAGCSAFAMHWLKATGVIPLVDESGIEAYLAASPGPTPFWSAFYRRLYLPWTQIGCDGRVGLVAPPQAARYTVHDLLFHDLTPEAITAASQGLAEMIRADMGGVAGTLFQYGALSPLRGLVIRTRRKDPDDRGDYGWAKPGEGLEIAFWDNGNFSDWVKAQWRAQAPVPGTRRAREGRFLGIEMDAMSTPRRSAPFYRAAEELEERRRQLAREGRVALSCRDVFEIFRLE